MHLTTDVTFVCLPEFPLVDVGNEYGGFVWAVNSVADRFRIFWSMWDDDRRDTDLRGQFDRLVVGHNIEFDILQSNHQFPGSVVGKEIDHSWHAVDGNALCSDGLATEMPESGVVAHVSVREENTRYARLFVYREHAVQQPQLLAKIGCGVYDPALR